MLTGRDHPLNEEGIQQCVDFNERWRSYDLDTATSGPLEEDFAARFFKTEAVLSSPLCRALQTAIVCMNGHPAVVDHGITCVAACREIKGGLHAFDCVGVASGDEVSARARTELGRTRDDAFASKFEEVVIDASDADGEWWTKSKDTKTSTRKRIDDFWDCIRTHRANSIVVVSHSNYMKEVLRSTGAHVTTDSKHLTEVLITGSNKLDNAACLATEYYFKGQEPAVLVTVRCSFFWEHGCFGCFCV
jgi:broad specificity phosphatase PhoE